MFGRNSKRPPVHGDGQILAVQEIFPTFQGEGGRAGQAAVFIRLGGCNLACAFCDTEFETYRDMSLSAILAEVARHKAPLAVITGGEPLRQPIEALCDALLDRGMAVQIETNGTLYRPLDARVVLTCSPKAAAGYYAPLRPDVLMQVSALKFIISATLAPYQDVPEVGQALRPELPVYVQPMDVYDPLRNARNVAHTIRLAQQGGYRLSMQLHKMIGVA